MSPPPLVRPKSACFREVPEPELDVHRRLQGGDVAGGPDQRPERNPPFGQPGGDAAAQIPGGPRKPTVPLGSGSDLAQGSMGTHRRKASPVLAVPCRDSARSVG